MAMSHYISFMLKIAMNYLIECVICIERCQIYRLDFRLVVLDLGLRLESGLEYGFGGLGLELGLTLKGFGLEL